MTVSFFDEGKIVLREDRGIVPGKEE